VRAEPHKQAGTPPTDDLNFADRLRILNQLRQDELMDEEEYQVKKREILEGIQEAQRGGAPPFRPTAFN
jgi:hypothetical protein